MKMIQHSPKMVPIANIWGSGSCAIWGLHQYENIHFPLYYPLSLLLAEAMIRSAIKVVNQLIDKCFGQESLVLWGAPDEMNENRLKIDGLKLIT